MKSNHPSNDHSGLLLLSGTQLGMTVCLSLGAAIATRPWWVNVSIWAGVALAMSVFVVAHLSFVCSRIVMFPHSAVLICAVQLGIAPWLSHYFPARNDEYSIPDIPQYFRYAGPALLAVALGWALSAVGFRSVPQRESATKADPRLLQTLDWLFWGGLLMGYAEAFFSVGPLGFLVNLLANLRFVGAMGPMLLSARGWKWRIVIVIVFEFSRSVGAGMFHSLILWLLSLLAVYLFVRRPAPELVWLWLAFLALGTFVLHDSKYQIREAVWGGTDRVTVFGKELGISSWNRPIVGSLCLVQSTVKVLSGEFSEESLSDMIMRYNQGWIIDRVLHHVPAEEPYACGETVVSAIRDALLPRVFAPNKQMAGGRVLMQRFAGYTPFEDTSMNIGFAGEMYANFGHWGGIVGCGIYALILGLLFRWVAMGARRSPLWWAIAAYVGHWALKAETDIGSVLNFMIKAAVVLFVVVMCLPALRAELTGRALPARRLSKRVRQPKIKPVKAGQAPAADQGPLTSEQGDVPPSTGGPFG